VGVACELFAGPVCDNCVGFVSTLPVLLAPPSRCPVAPCSCLDPVTTPGTPDTSMLNEAPQHLTWRLSMQIGMWPKCLTSSSESPNILGQSSVFKQGHRESSGPPPGVCSIQSCSARTAAMSSRHHSLCNQYLCQPFEMTSSSFN